MKKFRPILYSTLMVQSILNNLKNQTRRTKGLEKVNDCYFQSLVLHTTGRYTFVPNGNYNPTNDDVIEVKCPYGQVGDILWVRESFAKDGNSFLHRASHSLVDKFIKWKPSIHMPKDAARIFLQITDITVERLHDISESDAINEGCSLYGPFGEYKGSAHPNGGAMKFRAYSKASRAFQCLWESINGEESWKSNPWVWVIKFERIEKPQNFI